MADDEDTVMPTFTVTTPDTYYVWAVAEEGPAAAVTITITRPDGSTLATAYWTTTAPDLPGMPTDGHGTGGEVPNVPAGAVISTRPETARLIVRRRGTITTVYDSSAPPAPSTPGAGRPRLSTASPASDTVTGQTTDDSGGDAAPQPLLELARWDGTSDPVNPHVADPARRYNYWLGGKDNFQADRDSGDRIATRFPTIRIAALENRKWMQRAVAYLAQAGVRQFLDIGTGIPTGPNVHQIAQSITPDARVLYVDNSPIVMTHARALMTSTPPGVTDYLQADLRDPKTILSDPVLHAVLDLQQPVGLLMIAVLHFLDHADDPYAIVHRFLQALPPGSYLALTHVTLDPLPEKMTADLAELLDPAAGNGTLQPRTRAQVARFFDGLTLVEPGLVSIVDWLPEQHPRPQATVQQTAVYGAVARLP